MGTRSLTGGKLICTLVGTIKNTMDFSTSKSAQGQINHTGDFNIDDGSDDQQANRAWEYTATLASGVAQVLDLFDFVGIDLGAGDGKDITGQYMALNDLVAIKIQNNNALTNDAYLEIVPDDTNGWTPIGENTNANGNALYGKGILMRFQPALPGLEINDGSSHRIKLTAVGGDVNYTVSLLGREDINSSSSSSSSFSSSSSSSTSSSSSSSSSTSSGSSSSSSGHSSSSSSSATSSSSSSSSVTSSGSSSSSSSSSVTSSSSSSSVTSSSSSSSVTSSSSSSSVTSSSSSSSSVTSSTSSSSSSATSSSSSSSSSVTSSSSSSGVANK